MMEIASTTSSTRKSMFGIALMLLGARFSLFFSDRQIREIARNAVVGLRGDNVTGATFTRRVDRVPVGFVKFLADFGLFALFSFGL